MRLMLKQVSQAVQAPRTIEGPLYVAGAPETVSFTRMDDGSEEGKIPTLIIDGTVKDAEGNLIAARS